jgi:predicted unusual protein kinase regulating ubiquinone biosynthesis (AarF/ABC1/UbiB family)
MYMPHRDRDSPTGNTMVMLLLAASSLGLHAGDQLRTYRGAGHSHLRAPALVASAATDADAAANDITFPTETSRMQQAQRGFTFASRAVPIVVNYLRLFSTLKLQERITGECLDEEACEILWNEEHDKGSTAFSEVVRDLKGFYTKWGQVVASRQDLFPQQYTDKLAGLTDFVDPMEPSLVRALIAQELLHDDERFEDIFAEFDDEPLGAASVAQVHRAVLTEAYGGRTVAVKVQRPAIEAKLLGDVAALKGLAKAIRGLEAVPVDYYTVFSELEAQLADEFDFINEAAAMERIGNVLSVDADGTPCTPVLVTPRPVGGLVTRRVLVMDFLPG